MKAATQPQIACTHCGDHCGTQPIVWQDKPFCCSGCQSVYEIFQSNNLCEYYDLNDKPGIKGRSEPFEEKYAFLDAQEVKEKLLEFSDGSLSKVKFYAPKIHCSSCIWLLENLHRLDVGVTYSTVNFPKKEVSITFKEDETSLRKIAALMASVGYEPQINLGDSQQKNQKKRTRSVALKIGVAGFCFGNIMLLSIPDYLEMTGDGLGEFQQFFGYLNILLALPVIFFSGTEYFTSAWKGLKSRYLNIDVPIALGMIVLFVKSVAEIVTATGAGYMDSLAGLVFFLLIGKWYQNKTYQALSFDRDYTSYFPLAVTKKTANKEAVILAENVQEGDVLLIRNNELIPADGELVSSHANIDYSFVTGEADAVGKRAGDKLYAGGRQVGGAIEVLITKKVSKSYLTELWNQSVFEKEEQEGYRSLIDRFSKYFTAAILLIAFVTAAFWFWVNPSLAIESFTAVLIVACPCALALSMPFALGNSMRLLSKKGFFVKNINAIEKLSAVDAVVFDKTGTLTQSEKQAVQFFGSALSDEEKVFVKSLVHQSTHPLSKAVSHTLSVTPISVLNFKEVEGKGLAGSVNSKVVLLGSAGFVGAPKGKAEHRSSVVHVSIDGIYLGFYEVKKEYRRGLQKVLKAFRKVASLHLLTGDTEKEKPYLEKLFKQKSGLLFRQSPQDKLGYVQQLKAQGKTVLMIGDGLNDAGALKAADVGISLSDDVYNFSPACDAIMQANRFENLIDFRRFAEKSMTVVKLSLGLSLLYNVVGLSFAVAGVLSPLVAAILMPLSSITVVGFAILVTNLFSRKSLLGSKNQ